MRAELWLLGSLFLALVPTQAQAQCDVPEPKLLWSWPADGQANLPTNTQVFLSTQGDVARVLVDDEALVRKRDGFVSNAQFGLAHDLAPHTSHHLRIEFVATPASGNVGPSQEFDFTTGDSPVGDSLGEPRIESSRAMHLAGSLDPLCESVVRANGCYDTGENELRRLHSEVQPVAWVVEWGLKDQVGTPHAPQVTPSQVFWPSVCEDPSVFVRSQRGFCYQLHALDAAGHEHVGPVNCPEASGQGKFGCASVDAAPSLAALLLALSRRRRRG